MANNGDAIHASIVGELIEAGRSARIDQLGDDEIDWIEAVANDGQPRE